MLLWNVLKQVDTFKKHLNNVQLNSDTNFSIRLDFRSQARDSIHLYYIILDYGSAMSTKVAHFQSRLW